MVYDPNDYLDFPLRTNGQEGSGVYKDDPFVGVPKNPQEGVGGGLRCRYRDMPEWESCYGPQNRTCWLRNKNTGQTIDIGTDYENPKMVPLGENRTVSS
jgi:hypothetical protein